MKKIYMLACGVLVAAAGFAQSSQQNFPQMKKFTRDQITPIIAPRGEISVADIMRVDLLSEDFQGTSGNALPTDWTTNQVMSNPDGSQSGAMIDAYIVGDASDANSGGYWPVPDFPGNKFAQANDDGDPCDCDMGSAILTAPALDFTDVVNAALSFDIFHDQGFGGGDAAVEVSLDGGTTWAVLVDALPVDETVWQTVIVPLYDYSGEGSVTVRFNWTDAGSWASGFAVDNVVIGELADYNLAANKVLFGDWSLPDVMAGLYNFSLIPVDQIGELTATAVVSNNGFLDQTAATVTAEVFEDGSSVGTFASAMTTDIVSLDKDTLVVATGYTPVGGAGTEVMLTVTTSSDSGDDDDSDDMASTMFEISSDVYARDAGAAQAFVDPGTSYEFGNLFDFNADQLCGGLSVCVGGGSEDGAVFFGRVYEFEGFDDNGDPMLNDIGYETMEHTYNEATEVTGVGDAVWIDLPFAEGAQMMEEGVTYLAVVVTLGGSDLVRTPVSGTNVWPASLIFDTEWGWTLSIPMVRLNMDPTINVEETASAEFTVGQNMPNPVANVTRIECSLPQASKVTLTVTDMNGKLVMAEDYGTLPAGSNVIQIDAASWNAGMYNYTLTAGDASITKQMVVK